MLKKSLIVLGTLIMLAALLAACAPATPEATEAPAPTDASAPTEEAPAPEPTVDPAAAAAEAFAGSGHGDAAAAAFTYWDTASTPEIPTTCAKCHSPVGFEDFLANGKVTAAVPAPGQPLNCDTCHGATAMSQTEVTFPSGAVISAEAAGPSYICMNCHQGRQSTVNVNTTLANFGEDLDPDAVPAPYKNDQGNDVRLGFLNIHYYAAAATLYGAEVQGGYQYDGKTYDAKNAHVEMANSCIGCHNSHSLEVRLDTCAICHGEDAADLESLRNIREPSSAMDYDGDGDKEEGVYYEIQGLQDSLYATILNYALEVNGAGIVYDSSAHPYWFADADGDGVADEAEGRKVGYTQWTPRLLKAAYNYQTSKKDPGAFAHGGKYIIELLFDSIEDMNASDKLTTKTDMSGMHRTDAGHFDGSAEAWRHWDAAEDEKPAYVVEANCAKCHTATGLPLLLAGQEIPEEGLPAGNGLMCSTCHDSANWPALYAVNEVTMPSGNVVSFGEGDGSNLCLQCHQGRESKASVDRTIANFNPTDMDAVPAPVEINGRQSSLGFRNIHYFPAGVTIFGTEAQGAYEFDGKAYVGLNQHPMNNKCADCHNVHALELDIANCATCHPGVTDPRTIRISTTDFDGDGDVTEGIYGEIDTLRLALYDAIVAYAQEKGLNGILYSSTAYPYWFADANGDGQPDKNEEGRNASFASWTPNLLKAAFNFQYASKDTGGYAHNPKYVIQILIDSIELMGGDVSTYTRP